MREGTITKKEDIIQNGTKVLMNETIYIVVGNDSETSEVNNNNEYLDVNYFLIIPGADFNSEVMTWSKDFTII